MSIDDPVHHCIISQRVSLMCKNLHVLECHQKEEPCTVIAVNHFSSCFFSKTVYYYYIIPLLTPQASGMRQLFSNSLVIY